MNNPKLLGVRNGYLNLDTFEFCKGDREAYISLSMGCNYNPDLTWDDENVQKFLNYIYSLQLKRENAECLLYFLSQFLSGQNDDNYIYFFLGDGCNGKSVLIEFLQKLFTFEYCTILNYSMLTRRGKSSEASPDKAILQYKRLVIMNEANDNELIQSAIMKEMIGGDKVVSHPYDNIIHFDPQFKIIITCNQMPQFDSADKGTLRRIMKINFDIHFVDPKDNPKDYAFNERPKIKDVCNYKYDIKMLEAALWVLFQTYKKYALNGYNIPEDVRTSTNDCKN